MDKCGCGNDGHYIVKDSDGFDVYACNKYKRCPTYEELNSYNKVLMNKVRSCTEKLKIIAKAKEILNELG